jgi:predicted nucleic acid-binding protein
MIADTTFVSDLFRERGRQQIGPAGRFFAARRTETIRASIVTVGEVAVWFDHSWEAWEAMRDWTIYRLHPGIVDAAADVDRQLMDRGERLGENDNWIAGFARYYREPLISRDTDFDRVPGLRRLAY